MKDPVKSAPDYSGTQAKNLLMDLVDGSSHSQREKAIKRFKDYIIEFKPEFYDDDVGSFFRGSSGVDEDEHEGIVTGLLFWCGQQSSKHAGGLKRSCQNAINLVSWLISFNFSEYDDEEEDGENVFASQFLILEPVEYAKMQLALHVIPPGAKKDTHRSGSKHDAFELLALLLRSHRDEDARPSPLDLSVLLPNEDARQMFSGWLEKTAMDEERGILDANGGGHTVGAKLGAGAGRGSKGEGGGGGGARAAQERREHELAELVRRVRKEAPTRWADVQLDPNLDDPTASTSTAAAGQHHRQAGSGGDGDEGGSTDEEVNDPDWEEEEEEEEGAGAARGCGRKVDARHLLGTAAAGGAVGAGGETVGLPGSGGVGDEVELSQDPLGLAEINLAAVEQARLRDREATARGACGGGCAKGGGGSVGGRLRRGSLIGYNAKKDLLASLARSSSSAGDGDKDDLKSPAMATTDDGGAVSSPRALLRSSSSSGGGAGSSSSSYNSGSVLPTSVDFDAVTFMVLVHGEATLKELVEGRVHLKRSVGSEKESLEKHVRDNFGTFVRSADAIEHFSLAFDKVTDGALTTPSPTLAADAAASAEGTKHPAEHGERDGGGGVGGGPAPLGRQGSFFGSDAHTQEIEASVSVLDRVDLSALAELVAQSQEDAQQTFGLVLNRGNRLKGYRAARSLLAGHGALVDAPAAMKNCLLHDSDSAKHAQMGPNGGPPSALQEGGASYPRFGACVEHWRRVRQTLPASLKERVALLRHVESQADSVGETLRNALRDHLLGLDDDNDFNDDDDEDGQEGDGGDASPTSVATDGGGDDSDDDGLGGDWTRSSMPRKIAEGATAAAATSRASRLLKSAALLVEVGPGSFDDDAVRSYADSVLLPLLPSQLLLLLEEEDEDDEEEEDDEGGKKEGSSVNGGASASSSKKNGGAGLSSRELAWCEVLWRAPHLLALATKVQTLKGFAQSAALAMDALDHNHNHDRDGDGDGRGGGGAQKSSDGDGSGRGGGGGGVGGGGPPGSGRRMRRGSLLLLKQASIGEIAERSDGEDSSSSSSDDDDGDDDEGDTAASVAAAVAAASAEAEAERAARKEAAAVLTEQKQKQEEKRDAAAAEEEEAAASSERVEYVLALGSACKRLLPSVAAFANLLHCDDPSHNLHDHDHRSHHHHRHHHHHHHHHRNRHGHHHHHRHHDQHDDGDGDDGKGSHGASSRNGVVNKHAATTHHRSLRRGNSSAGGDSSKEQHQPPHRNPQLHRSSSLLARSSSSGGGGLKGGGGAAHKRSRQHRSSVLRGGRSVFRADSPGPRHYSSAAAEDMEAAVQEGVVEAGRRLLLRLLAEMRVAVLGLQSDFEKTTSNAATEVGVESGGGGVSSAAAAETAAAAAAAPLLHTKQTGSSLRKSFAQLDSHGEPLLSSRLGRKAKAPLNAEHLRKVLPLVAEVYEGLLYLERSHEDEVEEELFGVAQRASANKHHHHRHHGTGHHHRQSNQSQDDNNQDVASIVASPPVSAKNASRHKHAAIKIFGKVGDEDGGASGTWGKFHGDGGGMGSGESGSLISGGGGSINEEADGDGDDDDSEGSGGGDVWEERHLEGSGVLAGVLPSARRLLEDATSSLTHQVFQRCALEVSRQLSHNPKEKSLASNTNQTQAVSPLRFPSLVRAFHCAAVGQHHQDGKQHPCQRGRGSGSGGNVVDSRHHRRNHHESLLAVVPPRLASDVSAIVAAASSLGCFGSEEIHHNGFSPHGSAAVTDRGVGGCGLSGLSSTPTSQSVCACLGVAFATCIHAFGADSNAHAACDHSSTGVESVSLMVGRPRWCAKEVEQGVAALCSSAVEAVRARHVKRRTLSAPPPGKDTERGKKQVRVLERLVLDLVAFGPLEPRSDDDDDDDDDEEGNISGSSASLLSAVGSALTQDDAVSLVQSAGLSSAALNLVAGGQGGGRGGGNGGGEEERSGSQPTAPPSPEEEAAATEAAVAEAAAAARAVAALRKMAVSALEAHAAFARTAAAPPSGVSRRRQENNDKDATADAAANDDSTEGDDFFSDAGGGGGGGGGGGDGRGLQAYLSSAYECALVASAALPLLASEAHALFPGTALGAAFPTAASPAPFADASANPSPPSSSSSSSFSSSTTNRALQAARARRVSSPSPSQGCFGGSSAGGSSHGGGGLVQREALAAHSLACCLAGRYHVLKARSLRKLVRHGWTAPRSTTLVSPPSASAAAAAAVSTAGASSPISSGARLPGYISALFYSLAQTRAELARLLHEGEFAVGGGALLLVSSESAFGHLAGAALAAAVSSARARMSSHSFVSRGGPSGGERKPPPPPAAEAPVTAPPSPWSSPLGAEEALERAAEITFLASTLLGFTRNCCSVSEGQQRDIRDNSNPRGGSSSGGGGSDICLGRGGRHTSRARVVELEEACKECTKRLLALATPPAADRAQKAAVVATAKKRIWVMENAAQTYLACF